jgi:hypothetical protein
MDAVSKTGRAVRRIPLAAIKIDPAIQQRVAGTSQSLVAEYAEAMQAGDKFPPLVAFTKDNVTFQLGDGFHRVEAYRSAHPDVQEIECEVHPGDYDDALLFACGANSSHGLPRSISDKRKAVLSLLSSEKWSKWSDRQIARQCGVSHPFVAKVRSEHLETFPAAGQREEGPAATAFPVPEKPDAVSLSAPGRHRTVIRRGKPYTMRTAGIGVSRKTPKRPQEAGASPPLRSLAWSMADKLDRVRFVSAVGGHEILDVLKLIAPGFDVLGWAWKATGPAERQSFAEQYHNEIMALAAAPPERSTDAVLGVPKQVGGDLLAIPTFLQREHRSDLNDELMARTS